MGKWGLANINAMCHRCHSQVSWSHWTSGLNETLMGIRCGIFNQLYSKVGLYSHIDWGFHTTTSRDLWPQIPSWCDDHGPHFDPFDSFDHGIFLGLSWNPKKHTAYKNHILSEMIHSLLIIFGIKVTILHHHITHSSYEMPLEGNLRNFKPFGSTHVMQKSQHHWGSICSFFLYGSSSRSTSLMY